MFYRKRKESQGFGDDSGAPTTGVCVCMYVLEITSKQNTLFSLQQSKAISEITLPGSDASHLEILKYFKALCF